MYDQAFMENSYQIVFSVNCFTHRSTSVPRHLGPQGPRIRLHDACIFVSAQTELVEGDNEFPQSNEVPKTQ